MSEHSKIFFQLITKTDCFQDDIKCLIFLICHRRRADLIFLYQPQPHRLSVTNSPRQVLVTKEAQVLVAMLSLPLLAFQVQTLEDIQVASLWEDHLAMSRKNIQE